MKISENKFVSLAYTLTVDGQVADQATAERPLEFVYGVGMLLPKFEEFIAGKEAGEKFEFVLTPAEGYGEINPQAVVNLPKDVFMVDGAIPDDMLMVGNVLPMADQNGNRLMGTVKAVNENDVTMDFNHPMAGKTLNFTGDILGVREAKPEDMMPAGGCSCGSGSCGCEGGDCGDGGCGDGCGCH
ncbi:FKBP-type peptidyl-prolyl cis-trans isomerase [Rikenella microfusus]|uniref:FKBP-type peptidyl-prolyl cis-trans isomerase n=1 Tax=Rikenella microfusus TaxID=28139 RepID=UPI001D94CD2D|nr:peptidylprolyl isomerase [Rikenella microfusus]HJE89008.1 peptidylprolyl isomerase [Rikenella microfusus]